MKLGNVLLAIGVLWVGSRALARSVERDLEEAFGGDADMPYAYEFGGYTVVVDKRLGVYHWSVFSPLVWGDRGHGARATDHPSLEDAEAIGVETNAHAAMDAANLWVLEAQ